MNVEHIANPAPTSQQPDNRIPMTHWAACLVWASSGVIISLLTGCALAEVKGSLSRHADTGEPLTPASTFSSASSASAPSATASASAGKTEAKFGPESWPWLSQQKKDEGGAFPSYSSSTFSASASTASYSLYALSYTMAEAAIDILQQLEHTGSTHMKRRNFMVLLLTAHKHLVVQSWYSSNKLTSRSGGDFTGRWDYHVLFFSTLFTSASLGHSSPSTCPLYKSLSPFSMWLAPMLSLHSEPPTSAPGSFPFHPTCLLGATNTRKGTGHYQERSGSVHHTKC